MDIVENSIAAGASLIYIKIEVNIQENRLFIKVADNGKGMSPEEKDMATDPFCTTRTTREVGLGLPLFREAALSCEGDFKIISIPGKGTEIRAEFEYDHIDRAPLGDMAETLTGLIAVNPDIDFVYTHIRNSEKMNMDTRKIRKELGQVVKINNPRILNWIKNYLEEGLKGREQE